MALHLPSSSLKGAPKTPGYNPANLAGTKNTDMAGMKSAGNGFPQDVCRQEYENDGCQAHFKNVRSSENCCEGFGLGVTVSAWRVFKNSEAKARGAMS